MNAFEQALSAYFSTEQLRRIRATRVGIAGCGGLGSNCAMLLVRSGFIQLTLCDFDTVSWANLNRQFFFGDQVGMFKAQAVADNLRRINPDVQLTLCRERLTEDSAATVFRGCDVVVEAVDNADAKRFLAEEFVGTGVLYVSASGLAGWGRSDNIIIRRKNPWFYLVGDGVSAVSRELPPCAPQVTVAAAKQADVILSWVVES